MLHSRTEQVKLYWLLQCAKVLTVTFYFFSLVNRNIGNIDKRYESQGLKLVDLIRI